MKAYSTANVTAGLIIAMNREGVNTRIICDAPELGVERSTYEVVSAQFVKDNAPAVGGYLIDKAGVLSYMSAASFAAVFVAVP